MALYQQIESLDKKDIFLENHDLPQRYGKSYRNLGHAPLIPFLGYQWPRAHQLKENLLYLELCILKFIVSWKFIVSYCILTTNKQSTWGLLQFFILNFFHWFSRKGNGGRKRREMSTWERNTVRLPLAGSLTGDQTWSQACALPGNETRDLSVCRTRPNLLSHAGQGHFQMWKQHGPLLATALHPFSQGLMSLWRSDGAQRKRGILSMAGQSCWRC